MEFVTDQLRAVAFTPDVRNLQVAAVAGELLKQLPRFNGNPMILPIPAEAPGEVPRIVLQDTTGRSQFQVAMSRSDLLFNRGQGPPPDTASFPGDAAHALEIWLSAVSMRPARLAATAIYFHRCDDPAQLLAAHFCLERWVAAEGPFANLQSFEIHAHKRSTLLEGLVVNSWVRCKTGIVQEPTGAFPALVVERDLNTLPEEASARTFGPEELRAFFEAAGSALGAELPVYFP